MRGPGETARVTRECSVAAAAAAAGQVPEDGEGARCHRPKTCHDPLEHSRGIPGCGTKDLYKRFKKAVQEIQRKVGPLGPKREIHHSKRPLEAELGKNVVLEKKLETLAQQFDENLGQLMLHAVSFLLQAMQGSKCSSPKS